MSTTHLLDPFQGYDISVSVVTYDTKDTKLEGSFTGFMCRIVNQTEAYLPLNQRIPRMLDGEIIVAWSLEQGHVNDDWVRSTYGKNFADAIAKGRTEGNVIPRQRRFKVQMSTVTKHIDDIGEVSFNNDGNTNASNTNKINKLTLTLHYCRVDTGSFGVVAGRRVAASSWQGTAQSITSADDTATAVAGPDA